MADQFNRVFIEKVQNLKDKLIGPITADPAERLKVWLDKKVEHIPELNNILFHPNHHGFLPHHNTSTALAQMVDLWLKAAEDQELSATLLLDLSAAFDLVDHSVLLRKLKLYNLSDKSVELIKSQETNSSS
jgi:hypothetical protein